MKEPIFQIKLPKRIPRSVDEINKVLRECGYPIIDFRCKKPLTIECGCGKEYEFLKKKDFPLKDLDCKCGQKVIGWETTN